MLDNPTRNPPIPGRGTHTASEVAPTGYNTAPCINCKVRVDGGLRKEPVFERHERIAVAHALKRQAVRKHWGTAREEQLVILYA
jgi:hypothetical protein